MRWTRRLVFWGYLGTMLVGSILAGLFTIAAKMLVAKPQESKAAFLVETLAQHRGRPAELAREASRMSALVDIDVTLYSSDGVLLAATHKPYPMIDAALYKKLETIDQVPIESGLVVRAVRDDGQLVAIGIVNSIADLHLWMIFSGAIHALFMLGLALLFGRFVAVPLDRIASAARRFGAGDLTARTEVRRRDEIGEVGRAFDEMADRVTGLIAAQQELMANVSHELRTPLARMRVAVDLIVDGVPDQGLQILPGISEDLGELERLIEDVMTVSRLELSKVDGTGMPIRLEDVPLATIVEKSVSRFRASTGSHVLAVDEPLAQVVVRADPVMLRRVLDNVLENARKYSESGSTVRIGASLVDRIVAITISDEGIGMDAGDRERAFTPFFRSDSSRTRSTGGVGLGLALARRVMTAHDGRIELESELGRGTTVRLTLPVA